GGTKIQAVVVDQDFSVLGSARRPTPTTGGPADVADEMARTLGDAARAAELEASELAGIGVGSPGTIEGGNVTRARNLPGWEGTLHVRSARLHGGLCRAGGDGTACAEAHAERPQDGPLQADGGAPADPPDERCVGTSARPRRQARAADHRSGGPGARSGGRLR